MDSSESGRPLAANAPDAGTLAGGSLLAELPDESIDRLRARAKPVHLKMGEWLVQEGDRADCAYVVRSGRLEIISDGQIVRTASRGAVIGELALLTGGVRTASIRARRDCHLWRLERREFERLITSDHRFALALCRVLGSKLAEHRSPITRPRPPRTIAIVALDAGVSADDMAIRLTSELASAGKAAILRSGEWAPDADQIDAIARAEVANR